MKTSSINARFLHTRLYRHFIDKGWEIDPRASLAWILRFSATADPAPSKVRSSMFRGNMRRMNLELDSLSASTELRRPASTLRLPK